MSSEGAPAAPAAAAFTTPPEVAAGERPTGDQLVGAGDANACSMRCGRCGSLLLLPHKATLCQQHITLHKSRGGENAEQETLEWHWEVPTMWEFENVGFSNTLSLERPAKYLTCADCEQDVLGVQFLDDSKLYVAAARVAYAIAPS